MNVHRAEDIAQSPDMKLVTFNGTPVYIQNVDRQTGTARVYPLDNPQREFDAEVGQLIELEH